MTNKSTTSISRRVLLGAAPFAYMALSGRAHAAQTRITVTLSNWALQIAHVYIAKNLGYFEQEGLDVDLVVAGGGPKALAAVVGGSSQYSISVLSDVLLANHKGLTDIREVAGLSDGYSGLPLMIRKDVAARLGVTSASPFKEKIAALKGLRIGITTPGSGSDILVRYLLTTGGFQPDRDAEIVPVGQPEIMRAALASNRIDACVCPLPLNLLVIKQGLAILLVDASVDIPALQGVHYLTVHSSKSYNDANPKVALAFARSLTRSARLLAKDKIASREAVRPIFTQFAPEDFNEAWEFVHPLLSLDLRLTPQGVQKEVDYQNQTRPANDKLNPRFEEIVDNSWVERAATL